MTNRALLAGLAAGFIFFLSTLILSAVLPDTNLYRYTGPALGIDAKPEAMGAILLGSVILGLLLSYLYSRYAAIITFEGGAKTGAWLGGLIFLSVDLLLYGTGAITNPTTVVVDSVIGILLTALTGGVAGSVLGYRKVDRRGNTRRVRVRRY